MRQKLARAARQIYYSAWVGWQMESNWANPIEFLTYALVKPICHVLILVFIYKVVTGGESQQNHFYGMFVGNAFFVFVAALMTGIGEMIHTDREHFRVLKYIYCAPLSMFTYLSGRGATKVVLTGISTLLMLIFGRYVFSVPISLFTINYPLLTISFALGLLGIVSFGVMVAGFFLITARHGGVLSGGIAGLFYLASGTLFPIADLPAWLQPIGKAIPITYWIELTRRAVLGASYFEGLEHFSIAELLGILAASTFVTIIAAVLFFRAMERVALSREYIDRVTHY